MKALHRRREWNVNILEKISLIKPGTWLDGEQTWRQTGRSHSDPGWWLSRGREVTDSRYVRGGIDSSGCLIGQGDRKGMRTTPKFQDRVIGCVEGVPKRKKGTIWRGGSVFFIA